MDPISALILASIGATLLLKTGGSAISDTFAVAKGNDPPSLQKWRENQDRKERRGEQRTSEPSPWRRRWDNAVERHNAKAAQKHAAKMEDLRDQGRENVDRHKQRLRKRRARREQINSTVAGWGTSSWQAAKRAAESVQERAKERQAWRENTRREQGDPAMWTDPDSSDSEVTDEPSWVDEHGRGHPRRVSDESGWSLQLPVVYADDGNPYCVHPDGSWSSAETRPREAEDSLADNTVVPLWGRGEPATSTSCSTPDTDALHEQDDPHDPDCAGCARCNRHGLNSTDPDAESEDSDMGNDPERTYVSDPDYPAGSSKFVTVAELQRRRAAEQAQAEREHTERLARIKYCNDNTDAAEIGETPMSTTEITDLDTAADFVKQTAAYTDTVGAALSDIVAQLSTVQKGLATEAGQAEQGQSSLEDKGFNAKVTGKFSSSTEALNAAADKLREAVRAVSHASEQVSTTGGEMRAAAKVFDGQKGISEQLGAAAQNEGIAKSTGFYTSV